MNRRSSSKQNINTSYYDLTSPLSNLEAVKQRAQVKGMINNSFLGKVQMYAKKDLESHSMHKSQTNLSALKAGSHLYKLPEFSVSQVNYEMAEAIKEKAAQIKQQMVSNMPSLLSSSNSLPQLVPVKSANYNPKKLQNLLGHRSQILQLQKWLRSSLSKNPPTTSDQLVEYKQMIMGVGMKQLIRIINMRCLQQGKLVEQVWQLTWGICKEIILHMGQRAKKCEDLLAEEIIEFNKGCKRNFYEKEKELIQLKRKLAEADQKVNSLTAELQNLTAQNQKISQQSNKHFLENNYFNQEFLNVLQENLAMYLHLGDKSKRDWIKKMYKQVSKARDSIKNVLKDKVNRTVVNRIRQQNVFQDKAQNDLPIDENGDFIVDQNKLNQINQQNGQGQNIENTQQNQVQQQNHVDEECSDLKQKLMQQFQLKTIQTQTQSPEFTEVETQCQTPTFQQQEASTQHNPLEQIGVNTQTEQQTKKGKQPKQKQQKKPLTKGASKPKIQRKSSQVNETFQSRQLSSMSSSKDIVANNTLKTQEAQVINTQQKPSSQSTIIQYVCKQCFIKKSQEQALSELKYQEQEETLKRLQFPQSRTDRNEKSDKSQQRQNGSIKRKHQTKRKSRMSQMVSAKLNDEDGIAKSGESSSHSLNEHNSIGKMKRVLSNIEENKIVEDLQYETETDHAVNSGKMKKADRFNNWEGPLGESHLHHAISSTQQDDQLQGLNYPQLRNKNSESFHSANGKEEVRRNRNKRRDSSILHDISFKKEIQLTSNLKQSYNMQVKEEQAANNSQLIKASLPLTTKQPYYKFFTERISQCNKDFINEIVFQQSSNETILNNYFNMVQQVNSIPESRITMSEKQMLTMIEKNLMPIILQLLNHVKKSVLKKTVDQTIRNFYSLPFVLMKKFSTKYGVKILAIKNMKLLLSSLKKIQLVTDRYKSVRLMLFTDCRAMHSEDLFVYLLVLALVTPQLDIEKAISYQEVNEIRQICEKYLTKEKRVYEQFDNMTKQFLELNQSQEKLGSLKLAPLLRSIITSYRMVKINRIEEIGFVFLMLKKENFVEYMTFSFFMSCFKLETEMKVKIVKTFLACCDLKTKNKKLAISQSGFSRFLIKCPQFSFDLLNSTILKQISELNKWSSQSTTRKIIQTSKRMSEQVSMKFQGTSNHHVSQLDQIKSLASLKGQNDDIQLAKNTSIQCSDTRLRTQKAILVQSQRSLQKNCRSENDKEKELEREDKITEENEDDQIQNKNDHIRQKVSTPMSNAKHEKRHLSLMCIQAIRPSISQKAKHYSYFTYQMAKFLQNQEQTKYMSVAQKDFVQNYLIIHVMACEVEEIIGFIDYFSNDMLEIVCCDQEQMKIQTFNG